MAVAVSNMERLCMDDIAEKTLLLWSFGEEEEVRYLLCDHPQSN